MTILFWKENYAMPSSQKYNNPPLFSYYPFPPFVMFYTIRMGQKYYLKICNEIQKVSVYVYICTLSLYVTVKIHCIVLLQKTFEQNQK